MMKPMTLTDAATQTPPTANGCSTMASRRRGIRRWQGGLVGALGLLGLGLASPPPAAACSWYDPTCWVEESVDYFTDLAKDLGNLVWDVVTVDPQGAFHDVVDIEVTDYVCKYGYWHLAGGQGCKKVPHRGLPQ